MADGELERALDRAVRALARRDHSTRSLREKLDRAGIPVDVRDDALQELARSGYLDDARFACDRAGRLAARGYGDAWIRADLRREGVEREDVEAAIALLEPERERATRHAAASTAAGPRAVRALARRGFAEESLEGLVTELVAEQPRPRVP